MPAKKNKGIMDSIGDVAKDINKAISRPIRQYEAWQSKERDRAFDAREARIKREADQQRANKARGTQSSSVRVPLK
jgi:hypothetical protein